MDSYDLIALGGGPGGYTAAISAARLGASVCLVEKEQLGGTCTNRGCIPTKVLAASAHLLSKTKRSAEMGILLEGEARLDFSRVVKRRDAVVATLRDGIGRLLKANRVALVTGTGRLDGPGTVVVEGKEPRELKGKAIILATGSVPATLPFLSLHNSTVMTSDELLFQEALPKSLVVVGGGVVGCEFASIYNIFGVKVTVVELLDRLLPTLDSALSNVLSRAFKKVGIQVLTKATLEGAEVTDLGVVLNLPEGQTLQTDAVLVSVGRRSATAGIGLEEAGVRLKSGSIVTNQHMESGVEGVWAIGDAVGKTWLAHTAAAEAEVAVACALGEQRSMRYDVVPAVVFTDPELATVGLTPAEAEARGVEFATGRFYYAASSKALCDGTTEGLVEILADRGSGKILGGWVAGESAGSLIAEIAVAVQQGMTARELSGVIHAHPTLPEMVSESAADVLGLSIHKAPPRRR